MDKIKFGTDGWRGIIAKDFTLANVAKVAYAIARWLTGKYPSPVAVLGYDCRFGGEMFMEAIAKILASQNIRVLISESFVTTPMVSLAVVKLTANCGIMLTASHNSAEFNGIKLKGDHGGPMLEKDLKDVENMISSDYEFDLEMLNWNYLVEQGLIQYINLENIYLKNLRDHLDIEKLSGSDIRFAFDAMYGSSQNIFPKLMPHVKLLHCERNPLFMGVPPDPLPKNLHELEEYLVQHNDIYCALAVDGDGDRLALFDEQGTYYDSHRLLLLMTYYIAEYKKLKGKVVVGFSVTSRLEKICARYGLELIRVPIGFKEISRVMLKENVLLGGEESGGMTTGTYLPERDGIWIGLTIWEWLIDSGKTLSQLMEEVYSITGLFAYERRDIEINRNARTKVLEHFRNSEITKIGEFHVTSREDIDGYKFHFGNDQWVMIRPSGTEPVLRIYAEAENQETVTAIINSALKLVY